jgi:hypothetical protein
MSSVIKANTKKILSGMVMDNARKGWNCKGGLAVCPMQGNCLDKSRVYKAEVTTAMTKKHFYGQTFRTFKERFYGHQSDLRNQAKADSTTLSKYLWQDGSRGEEPEIRRSNNCFICAAILFRRKKLSTMFSREYSHSQGH